MPVESSASIDDVILALCRDRGSDKTICPTEAAKEAARLAGRDDLAWRGLLTAVRQAAVRLATAGRIAIYRKGKPVDPHDFRGVYRLGMTRDE